MTVSPSKTTDSKSTNQQDSLAIPETHTIVPRDWPTWPPTHATTSQLAHRGPETSVRDPTPMQRWMNETSQQSPWNSIAAVAVEKNEYGEGPNGGDSGTTAGTWGSRSE
ncbi:hypothetical protein VTL71DRAFT_8460 [Oculimacula yallundae]|uniref:Uncharacterized protein n=1 Tax=Oculimacula yallundae TaxID=86028 RepID=A0ABR4CXT2_9HELO